MKSDFLSGKTLPQTVYTVIEAKTKFTLYVSHMKSDFL